MSTLACGKLCSLGETCIQVPSRTLDVAPEPGPITALSQSTQTLLAMKVKIKSWNAVASWKWDVPEDEVCGICRVQFDGTCPNCRFPGDDCSLLVGKCGHSFHMHCLLDWINTESSRGLCPMCRQKFEYVEQ